MSRDIGATGEGGEGFAYVLMRNECVNRERERERWRGRGRCAER